MGAFIVRFLRSLMLEFRFEDRNTDVLLEIDFEHFYGNPKHVGTWVRGSRVDPIRNSSGGVCGHFRHLF